MSCNDAKRNKRSLEVAHAWHDCFHHSEPLWGQYVLLASRNSTIQQEIPRPHPVPLNGWLQHVVLLGFVMRAPLGSLTHCGPSESRRRAGAAQELFHSQDSGFDARISKCLVSWKPDIGHAGLQGHVLLMSSWNPEDFVIEYDGVFSGTEVRRQDGEISAVMQSMYSQDVPRLTIWTPEYVILSISRPEDG